jgi:hypothetical protein
MFFFTGTSLIIKLVENLWKNGMLMLGYSFFYLALYLLAKNSFFKKLRSCFKQESVFSSFEHD